MSISSPENPLHIFAFADRVFDPLKKRNFFSAIALAVQDNRVVARHESRGSNTVNATASVVGKAVRAVDRSVSSVHVMPHERTRYVKSKPCRCPVCLLVNDGASGEHVTSQMGSPEHLPWFEQVQRDSLATAQCLVDESRNITVCGLPWNNHRLPMILEYDDNDAIVARRIADSTTHAKVWTDASVSTDMVGVAAVSASGGRMTDSFRDSGSPNHQMRILHGELTAILHAVRQWTGAACHLTVHSDSLHAVTILNEFSGRFDESSLQVNRVVARIMELVSDYRHYGGTVTFEWVRGHEGEVHNETAHRLANTARRTLEWELSDDTAAAQMDNIVADMLEVARQGNAENRAA